MATKPGEANFFPEVPTYPEMGTFQPVYGKFDLTTYIQGASDYEIMAFLVGKYNACLEAYDKVTKLSNDTITAAHQLQDWINTWFDNLDVQQELNNKIDSMVADGSFGTLLHQTFDEQINQHTTNAVTAWLVANVKPTGSAVVVDKSLSIDGAAADAKVTGDVIKTGVSLYPVFEELGSPTGYYTGETNAAKVIHLNKNYLIRPNALQALTNIVNKPNVPYLYIWGASNHNGGASSQGYGLNTLAFSPGTNQIYLVRVEPAGLAFFELNTTLHPTYEELGSATGDYTGETDASKVIHLNKNYLIRPNALKALTKIVNKPDVPYLYIWGASNHNGGASSQGYGLNTLAFSPGTNQMYLVRVEPAGLTFFELISGLDNTLTSTTQPPSGAAVRNAIADINIDPYYTSPNGGRWKLSVDDSGNVHATSIIPKKISFIGNSLLSGFSGFGMAASERTKDYFYIVTSKMPGVNARKNAGGLFETQTTESGAMQWIADNITNGNVVESDDDAVVIQLGDNVNAASSQEFFPRTSLALLQAVRKKAPNASVYWAGVWYAKPNQTNYLAENCKATGAKFINFTGVGGASHLGAVYTLENSVTTHYDVLSYYSNTPTNLTLNFDGYSATINCDSYSSNAGISVDVVGKEIVITNPGVATHPGDEGMAKIGALMLKAMGLE